MPSVVVVGCQTGDEGKGKIVDFLAAGIDKWEDLPRKIVDFLAAGIDKWEDLPKNAQLFLEKISDFIRVPIAIVSTGASRKDTIAKADVWKRLI
jgi:adenylosuccinate synthase